jgi:hypothetical protein
MKRSVCACVLAGLAFGLVPATTPAQSGSRQSAELRFVEQRPGVPSALTLNIDYVNPDDPGGKPPAVQTVVEELAPGARIDTSVPELCTASDAELMLMGASACPPGSRVGSGTIRVDTGFPEPGRFIDADVTFLNNTNQLIFVSTERGSGTRVVSRSEVENRRILNSAPPLPGTPPDGGAIDVVEARLDAVSRVIDGVRRGYVTTPGNCALGRGWTNSVTFTYADGVSQTVETQSRCSRRGGSARASKMRVKKILSKGREVKVVLHKDPTAVGRVRAVASKVGTRQGKRMRVLRARSARPVARKRLGKGRWMIKVRFRGAQGWRSKLICRKVRVKPKRSGSWHRVRMRRC